MPDQRLTPPEMTAKDAIELVQLFAQHGIEVWVDGGWAVDALLGRNTRVHADLDIALRHKDVPLLRQLLEERGYSDVPRDDTRDCNFVLGDNTGREVDIHSFTFDDSGTCIFGCPYPLESLTGKGSIDGIDVKCISPEWLVKFHSGYKLTAKDFHDVSRLCEKFKIELPAEYKGA